MSFAYVEAAGCVHCTQDFVTFVTDDGLTECALQVKCLLAVDMVDLLVRKDRINFEPNGDSVLYGTYFGSSCGFWIISISCRFLAGWDRSFFSCALIRHNEHSTSTLLAVDNHYHHNPNRLRKHLRPYLFLPKHAAIVWKK